MIKERAINTDKLEMRLQGNRRVQKLNLGEWIFSRVDVMKGSQVLELCCGNGHQSVIFDQLLGNDGELFMVDASTQAIDEVKSKLGIKKRYYYCQSLDHLCEKTFGEGQRFDLIFCAYGLYYAEEPERLLNLLCLLLKQEGRIVIVGPYGENNGELFRLLEGQRVQLSQSVISSSRSFMPDVVANFARKSFAEVDIQTIKNEQIWPDREGILDYWKNTTFYDEKRMGDVKAAFAEIFNQAGQFVVTKHIMLIKMSKYRRKV